MGCASSKDEPASTSSGGVRDLGEVRQLISSSVKDEELRRKLLRLAGAAPQVWTGCSRQDVVGVLVDELAERERDERAQKEAVKVTAATPQAVYSVPPAQQPVQPEPPVQVVHVAAQPRTVYVQDPAFVPRGPRLGPAILTGVVAGRVAGRTAARTAARRRRF